MLKLNSLPDLLKGLGISGSVRALDLGSEDGASIEHLASFSDGVIDVVPREGAAEAIRTQLGGRVRLLEGDFEADERAYDVVVVSPVLGQLAQNLRDMEWRAPRLLKPGGVWITFGIDPKALTKPDFSRPDPEVAEQFCSDFDVVRGRITAIPACLRGCFELVAHAPRKPIYRSYLSWMAFRMLPEAAEPPPREIRVFTDHRAHSLMPGLPNADTIQAGAAKINDLRPSVLMVVDNDVLRDARVVKTAETVADLGQRVVLVGIGEAGDVVGEETRGGVPVVLFPSPRVEIERRLRMVGGPLDQGVRRELRMAAFSRWLAGVLERLSSPPSVIHSHDFQSIYVVGGARELLDRPPAWVHDVHEFIAEYEIIDPDAQAVGSKWERYFIAAPDAVTCVSEEQAASLKAEYGRPVDAVIYNTQKLANRRKYKGRTLRQRLGLAEDRTLLVHSGSVREGRGIEHVIRVLPQFPRMHLALITASRGPFVNALLNDAKTLGVRDRVHMSALLPYDEVAGFIADADAGIIPMDSYGNAELSLPNKIFDYILAGLPVVSSSTGAIRRLFAEWPIGPLYEPGDTAGLARALVELEADGSRYVRALAARPDLLVKHAWEAQAVKLQRIYDGLPLAAQGRVR
ncbi:MAG: glycosyltransferase [Caulobacteraceae bacterium]|nr:glycosyltransferase [Caulobacteraceae bacterium]